MQCIKSDCIPCQGTEPFARRPVGVRRGQRECKNILPAFFGTTCKCQWLFVTFHLSSLTRRYGSAHCMHTSSLILAVCFCKHLFLMFLSINKINLDYQLNKLSFEMLYVCILLVKKAIILMYFNPKLKRLRYVEADLMLTLRFTKCMSDSIFFKWTTNTSWCIIYYVSVSNVYLSSEVLCSGEGSRTRRASGREVGSGRWGERWEASDGGLITSRSTRLLVQCA